MKNPLQSVDAPTAQCYSEVRSTEESFADSRRFLTLDRRSRFGMTKVAVLYGAMSFFGV